MAESLPACTNPASPRPRPASCTRADGWNSALTLSLSSQAVAQRRTGNRLSRIGASRGTSHLTDYVVEPGSAPFGGRPGTTLNVSFFSADQSWAEGCFGVSSQL